MTITMEILDAAKYYYDETGDTELHYHHGNPALRLGVAICAEVERERYARCGLRTQREIARNAIELAIELS